MGIRELDNPRPTEILGIDQADRVVFLVEDHQFVHGMALEEIEERGGEFAGLDGDRARGHELTDRLAGQIGIVLEGPGEVSLGEDAGEGVVRICQDHAAGPATAHGADGFADGGIRGDKGEPVAGAHDVGDECQECAAETAAGAAATDIRAGLADACGDALVVCGGGSGGAGAVCGAARACVGASMHAGAAKDEAAAAPALAVAAVAGAAARLKSHIEQLNDPPALR